MSNDTRPFSPIYRNTRYTQAGTTSTLSQQGQCELSVTVTSNGTTPVASTQLPAVSPSNFCQVQISNTTDKWAFVNFGIFGNVRAAGQTDYPVAPGAVQVVTVPSEADGASVVLQAAAGSLTAVIFTRGSGT